ncbi:PepSY-like domain-containing protein [Capnocytophaga cynodegmi]|uniref:PepSY-like domain-containing protein n=1 Tax=Capnocytophaga cynodegmi TaxID=28189 RepID=UPI001EE1F33E|nr:PepSY-like domain-containing protein [Capnocytophaga cynodegmi]
MRKLFSKLAIIALATSLMAYSCEKDDLIPYNNLPNTAQSFISKYFNGANVVKTETESNGRYSVDLSNGVEVDFDANGNWTKVDARDGQALSAVVTSMDFIPQSIINHVTTAYPKNTINSIEKKKTGYEVDLVGVEKDIYFDVNGQPISSGTGNNNGGNGSAGTGNTTIIGTVPQIVQTNANNFLATYFPSIAVIKIEVETNKVDYDLANGVDVDFDLNGNWINVDARDGQALSNTAFIPQNIINHLRTAYPNNAINGIEKTVTGYEVELVGIKNDIHFNANGQPIGAGNNNGGNGNAGTGNTTIIGTVPQIVQTNANNFLATYFPSIAVIKIEVESNKVDYDLANGVDIDFDLINGNWINVDARDGQALSNTAFITQSILNHLRTTYPNNPINGIEKTVTGYEVELVGIKNDIHFNTNGQPIGAGNNNGGNGNAGTGNTTIVGTVTQVVQTNANNFLATHFPSIAIKKIEVESNKVEYDLVNGVDIDFDLNGNWINVDAPDRQSIPTGFIPAAIRRYVQANYSRYAFNSIEKKANSYEVELVGFKKDLIFDLNGNFIRLD